MEASTVALIVLLVLIVVAVASGHRHRWGKWSAVKHGTITDVLYPSVPSLRSESKGAWNYQDRTCTECGLFETKTVRNDRDRG